MGFRAEQHLNHESNITTLNSSHLLCAITLYRPLTVGEPTNKLQVHPRYSHLTERSKSTIAEREKYIEGPKCTILSTWPFSTQSFLGNNHKNWKQGPLHLDTAVASIYTTLT